MLSIIRGRLATSIDEILRRACRRHASRLIRLSPLAKPDAQVTLKNALGNGYKDAELISRVSTHIFVLSRIT